MQGHVQCNDEPNHVKKKEEETLKQSLCSSSERQQRVILAEKAVMIKYEEEWVNSGKTEILKDTNRTQKPFPEKHGNHPFYICGYTFNCTTLASTTFVNRKIKDVEHLVIQSIFLWYMITLPTEYFIK